MRGLIKEYRAFILPAVIVVALIVMSGVAIQRTRGQEPTSAVFPGWRREGLKGDIDQLRADLDQLRGEFDALALVVETTRSAAAFNMGYQADRLKTLKDADFPVGFRLSDVAGTWHELTQEQKDAIVTAAAKAEALYTALTTP